MNICSTAIDECRENIDGCKEDTSARKYCTDRRPDDGRFSCSCDEGFEIFTGPGHNGFGMVVQYGDDVGEDPGFVRVVNKSCIRTYADAFVYLFVHTYWYLTNTLCAYRFTYT